MIKNFTLTPQWLEFTDAEGSQRRLYRNQNSGRIFFRFKMGTLADIRHPGIYLGHDNRGSNYFMHNHYQSGYPSIVTEQEFAQGQPCFWITKKRATRNKRLVTGWSR